MLSAHQALVVVIRVIRAIAGRTANADDQLYNLGFMFEEDIRRLTNAIAYHPEGVRSFGHSIDPNSLSNVRPSSTVRDVAEQLLSVRFS